MSKAKMRMKLVHILNSALSFQVWIEPQDGVVTKEGHNWDEVVGVTFESMSKIIFPKDNEVISCLLTCEHLALMCQKKESLGPQEMLEKANSALPDLQNVRQENGTDPNNAK